MGKRRSPEEWETLIKEQSSSGMSQSHWCKTRGINYHSFKNGISQLRESEEKQSTESVEEADSSGWVHVTPRTHENNLNQTGHHPSGRITIEIGMARLVADGEYPLEKVARLCRELVKIC